MSELALVLEQLEAAKFPEDVFGADPKGSHRRLVHIVHPDHNAGDPHAKRAFHLLTDWWIKAQRRIAKGVYGTKTPDIIFTIKTKHRSYQALDVFAKGDASMIYTTDVALLKVVNNATDNDLLDHEVTVIKALRRPEKGFESFIQHLPAVEDTLRVGSRRVNAFALPHVPLTSIAAIMKAFPHGIDPRDAVWMWRRALRILGYVHHRGYTHGAVTPDHLMMDLANHNITLVGWTAAVKEGPLKIIAPAYRDLYPHEMANKQPAEEALDLYMLGKVIIRLLGGDTKTNSVPKGVPKQMGLMLRGCTMEAPQHRFDNAWWLHDEVNLHLIKWFGPRKFRVFTMPD